MLAVGDGRRRRPPGGHLARAVAHRAGRAAPRRVGWHLLSKATWQAGALTVVEAAEAARPSRVRCCSPTGRRGGCALADPGRLPEAVHGRVDRRRSVSRHHRDAARRRRLVRAAQGARAGRDRAAGPARPRHRRRGRAPGRRLGRRPDHRPRAGPTERWRASRELAQLGPDALPEFDDHRARPFHDLLARVGATAPRRVVDLGCGPGHLTGLLTARWPGAAVEAVDSSPDMVAAARERGIDARQVDVVDWMPATGHRRRGHQRGAAVGAGAPASCCRAGWPRCPRAPGSPCRCQATSAPRRTRWSAS